MDISTNMAIKEPCVSCTSENMFEITLPERLAWQNPIRVSQGPFPDESVYKVPCVYIYKSLGPQRATDFNRVRP